MWHILEVLLGVIPGLNKPVTEAVRTGLICLKIVELVTAAGQRILNMIDDALLNAKHIIPDVCIYKASRHNVRL